jgi:hypothetical protein
MYCLKLGNIAQARLASVILKQLLRKQWVQLFCRKNVQIQAKKVQTLSYFGVIPNKPGSSEEFI